MEGQEVTIVIRKGSSESGLYCQINFDGVYVDSVHGMATIPAALEAAAARVTNLGMHVANDWSTTYTNGRCRR